jgi:hypothetical protein
MKGKDSQVMNHLATALVTHEAAILYGVGAITVTILLIAALLFLRNRKTNRLRAQFGPEYDHAVEQSGRGKAEAGLRAAEKRVDKLTLRSPTATERDFYLSSWAKIQTKFVDDPAVSVTEADQLLGLVMSTCGYSLADFDQRAADISVEHPLVVQHYRAGHDIAMRQARGQATTEDQRQAMINYRTLFDELIGAPQQARLELAS